MMVREGRWGLGWVSRGVKVRPLWTEKHINMSRVKVKIHFRFELYVQCVSYNFSLLVSMQSKVTY